MDLNPLMSYGDLRVPYLLPGLFRSFSSLISCSCFNLRVPYLLPGLFRLFSSLESFSFAPSVGHDMNFEIQEVKNGANTQNWDYFISTIISSNKRNCLPCLEP